MSPVANPKEPPRMEANADIGRQVLTTKGRCIVKQTRGFGALVIPGCALLLVFTSSLVQAMRSSSTNYMIPWYVLDGGGGTSISTNYTVTGSAGQPSAVGNSAMSTNYVLYSGFHTALDSDGDTLKDFLDNCMEVANPDQLDTDGDGYGNLCDGDLNNDGSTNTLDLNLYKLAHRSAIGDANYNVDADFNGDGSINTLDLNIYKGLHRKPPGPSCCTP